MGKQSKNKKRQSIPRQTRRFQLRKNNPVDTHVGEILDYARSQRKEVTTIRDGVRLIWALENNDLSVLFEMFPHLKPQLIVNGEGGGSLEDKEIMVDLLLSKLKTNGYVMVTNQPPMPQLLSSDAPTQPMQPITGKPLGAGKVIAAPTFEDDDDSNLLLSVKGSNSASDNLLRMFSSMARENDESYKRYKEVPVERSRVPVGSKQQ